MTERYRIELAKRIDAGWSDWLGQFEVFHTEEGNTVLIGNVSDQAALHGLLARIRDLGCTILLVARLPTPKNSQSDIGSSS